MGRKSRIKKEVRQSLSEGVPQAKPPAAPFPFLKVALIFAAIGIVLEGLTELVIDWSPLQLATAKVATVLLRLTGIEVVANGIHMALPNAQWEIVADCTAIGAVVIFLSFVLPFPSSIKTKAWAVGAGVPSLFVVNILRLLILSWLTMLSPTAASYYHDFVWQCVSLFLIVGMWLAWIEWVVKREKNPAVPA